MSMQEIEVLRQQKKELEDKLVAIDQGIEPGNRHAIQDEINTVVNKISELEYELKLQEQTAEIEAQHEEQAKEVAKNNAYVLDTLEVEGLSMSQLSASATAYEILREAVQQVLNTQTQKVLDQLKAVKEESAKTIAELQKQNDLANEALQLKTEQYNLLRNDYTAIVDENKDLATKRDAAAAELESSKAEIDRLNEQVQELRTEIAVGAKAAVRVINTTEDLKAKADAFKKSIQDSIIPIYNKRWENDQKKDFYLAEVAETGETIRFNWITEKKYKEVTPADAETFRTERAAREAKQAETDSAGVLEMEEQPVTAGQFQPEAETATAGLDQDNAGVAMAGKTVTREEFEQLKAEVESIKARIAV